MRFGDDSASVTIVTGGPARVECDDGASFQAIDVVTGAGTQDFKTAGVPTVAANRFPVNELAGIIRRIPGCLPRIVRNES